MTLKEAIEVARKESCDFLYRKSCKNKEYRISDGFLLCKSKGRFLGDSKLSVEDLTAEDWFYLPF